MFMLQCLFEVSRWRDCSLFLSQSQSRSIKKIFLTYLLSRGSLTQLKIANISNYIETSSDSDPS